MSLINKGPSIMVANNDEEAINLINNISDNNFTNITDALDWISSQDDIFVQNKPYEDIVTDGLVLYLDASSIESYPMGGNKIYDISGLRTDYNVVNIALPLNDWEIKRSIITEITDGSILPPKEGMKVWKSTINNSLYANTLHRMWNYGVDNGVIGEFGNGYYRYYMWVKLDSGNSSSNASISIDISDGKISYLYPDNNWKMIEVWDNSTGNYNSTKFFDYYLVADDGDSFYISSIVVARYDVIQENLIPLNYNPGFMDYNEVKKIGITSDLINGIIFNNDKFTTDGINDYLKLLPTDSIKFNSNDEFTMSILVKKISNPVDGNTFCIFMYGSGTPSYGIDYYFVGSNIRYGYRNSVQGQMSYSSSTNTLEKWTYIIYTYTPNSSTGIKLYINSILDSQHSSIGISDFYSNSYYSIGSNSALGGTPRYANISFNNIKIYNKSLTQQEILQNYYKSLIITDNLVYVIDPSNIISYENGSSNVYDLTETGDATNGYKTGTLTNGVEYSNGSFIFDGVDDQIRLDQGTNTTNPIQLLGQWSVSIWIKPIYTSGGLFSHWSGGPVNLSLEIQNGKIAMKYYDGQWNYVVSTGYTIETNKWVNLTWIMYNSTSPLNMYINGKLDYQVNPRIEWPPYSYTQGYQMGVIGSSWYQYFKGYIGNMLVYNSSLTNDQILQNYNAQKNRFI